MQEATAINFTNNNAANAHDLTLAEFEALLRDKHSSAEVVFDFVPVLVYADNDELVAYYDEELEWGYIA